MLVHEPSQTAGPSRRRLATFLGGTSLVCLLALFLFLGPAVAQSSTAAPEKSPDAWHEDLESEEKATLYSNSLDDLARDLVDGLEEDAAQKGENILWVSALAPPYVEVKAICLVGSGRSVKKHRLLLVGGASKRLRGERFQQCVFQLSGQTRGASGWAQFELRKGNERIWASETIRDARIVRYFP